jgi:hypothetical protein
VRHHGLKTETPLSADAVVSALVRNQLSLFGTVSECASQFGRNIVRINVLAQIDVIAQKVLSKSSFAGAIGSGNHEQKPFAQRPTPPTLGYGTP